ncbi:MAG TPA: hypothetical protein VNL91_02150 [Thermoanaerobaculia bacterium]|nr:hypothetical protein [Thermoanaerobaculia bacterium]
MIACQEFRAAFAPATEDPGVLEHLRACDDCLDYAAHRDPEVMFRALGGPEMVPPGGLEAFVDDVMRQVQVRSTENEMDLRPHLRLRRRFAVAAALVLTIAGSTLFLSRERPVPGAAPVPVVSRAVRPFALPVSLTTKPAVETYQAAEATIVEVPQDGDDVKVVMIFDESLPADL